MIKNPSISSSIFRSKKIPIFSATIGIISLIIGFGPLIIACSSNLLSYEFREILLDLYFDSKYCLLFYRISIPFAFFGILLGIIGRKSPKRGLANLGIVLSSIALLILIFWYFFYWGFSHMQ